MQTLLLCAVRELEDHGASPQSCALFACRLSAAAVGGVAERRYEQRNVVVFIRLRHEDDIGKGVEELTHAMLLKVLQKRSDIP